jgi:hypothetical protein
MRGQPNRTLLIDKITSLFNVKFYKTADELQHLAITPNLLNVNTCCSHGFSHCYTKVIAQSERSSWS